MTLAALFTDALKLAAEENSQPTREAAEREPKQDKVKGSQATALIRLAREAGAGLFHADGTPYFAVRVGDHVETHRLRSRSGRAWLVGLFMDAFHRAPSAQAMTDAQYGLEALALRGPDVPVHVRLAAAEHSVWIDPIDSSWRLIEITKTSWHLVSCPSVRFRRPKGLLSLPLPQPGGTIDLLRPFVNVGTHEDFVLLVAVLVAWLRARGPYPVLVLNGEQGSAKSTLARVLKGLIDPNAAALRSAPREPRDLMIAAANGHALMFDNLSTLPDWLSDAICRLSTGGGFSTRTLYSDDEEMLFDATKPVLLNGIPDFATRQDLVSRSIFLTLPPIHDTRRRDEASFWTEFETARPFILGALLDILATAIRLENTITLTSSPRMADFARLMVAAEAACPWPAGTFMTAYTGNRANAIELSLDGDIVADTLKAVAPWRGTARQLLQMVNERAPEGQRSERGWFKNPRQIADAVRRLAPALRTIGVEISFSREAHTRRRLIQIEKGRETAVPASPSVPRPETWAQSGDEDNPPSNPLRRHASPKTSIGDAGTEGDVENRPLSDGEVKWFSV